MCKILVKKSGHVKFVTNSKSETRMTFGSKRLRKIQNVFQEIFNRTGWQWDCCISVIRQASNINHSAEKKSTIDAVYVMTAILRRN